MSDFFISRNDILRKHGIIPEKPPSPTPMIEEALVEARRLAHENRLESKDLDELAELEDEEDEDFLNQYRSVVHNKNQETISSLCSGRSESHSYPPSRPSLFTARCIRYKRQTGLGT